MAKIRPLGDRVVVKPHSKSASLSPSNGDKESIGYANLRHHYEYCSGHSRYFGGDAAAHKGI